MQTSGLPTRVPTPFADSGAKNTIPIPSQISITPGAASFTDGFPPLTMTPIVSGGIPPKGQDFNGILNAITNSIRWGNAGGQYPYDATFSAAIGGYPKGALLARSGFDGYWVSQVENNTTNPDTGGAGWASLSLQGGDYGIDSGTANAYAVTFAPAVIALKDGQTLKFKALNANAGASTLSPNGLTAAPIVGGAHAALQGGEIIPNGDVWVQWNSSIGTGSWVLIDSTGGALQVANATKSQHAVNAGQIQTQGLTAFTTGGTAPAFTLTPTPAITAYATNQRFQVTFSAAGTTPTLNVSGLGAKNLKQYDSGGNKISAVITSGQVSDVVYDGTDLVVLDQLPASVPNLVGIKGSSKNLVVTTTGLSSIVTATADEIIVESAANTYQVLRAVSVAPSLAASGVNGLDTGTSAASTWYSIWVIWNGTTTAGLLSLSTTTPTLPAGYTHAARVGWVYTDATANKYPLLMTKRGQIVDFTVKASTNRTNMPIIASGTAGNPSTPTWIGVSLSAVVPPTAITASIVLNAVSGGTAMASPSGQHGAYTSTTNPPPMVVAAAGGTGATYGWSVLSKKMLLETSTIYWAASISGFIACDGYEDSL